jgi:hypothetical protein
MADTFEADRKAATAAINAALETYVPQQDVKAAAGIANPKEGFCKNWPAVRTALQGLNAFAPGGVKIFIGLVIAAGDAASGALCKAA